MEKKTILLVEDDSLVRDILKTAFEREYRVLEASGFSEAKELLHNPIDIALIDYMLPDGDGFDVLRAIRKVIPELPVLFMTAYSAEGVVMKAFRAGATEYVKKPLVLASVRKKVSDILEGKSGEEITECFVESDEEHFLMDGIGAFIENNYADDLTRDDLAGIVRMNKYKFSKLFNERFGRSVRSYINDIRVKKAVELLRNNKDLDIEKIATAVGYRSINHFERVFKEICGVSPREYRQNPHSFAQK
jgi:two-component system response regulator YesN